MPSQLNTHTGLPSSSTGFKIRRVASGLLPQQVRPNSSRQIHSDIRSDINDVEGIETPVSLKESKGKSNDAIHARVSASYSTPKIPSHGTPITDHYQEFLKSDRDMIRNEKIIGHQNEIGLSSAQKLAERNLDPEFFETHIMNQPDLERLMNEPDIEFDPSDHDVSDTSPSMHREERANLRASAFLDRSPPKTGHYVSSLTRTPRRRSPLRQVVGISSSVKSVAEEIADEIARSGATKSKTTQEILDQINSSVERLREKENTFLDVEEDSEEERDILKSLDDILPKEAASKPPPLSSGNPAEQRDDQIFPAVGSSAEKKEEVPQRSARRNELGTRRKLSGKYARDVLRKRKIKNGGPYGSWSKEKWNKLKRLVKLSIPREVLANSKLVMQDLQCSKKELADRIYFLDNHKRSY